jgi:hypothetical protein
MEEVDGFGGTLSGEAAGLIEEFVGEVESGEIPKSERPQSKCYPACSTSSFDQRQGTIRKVALDQNAFRLPESELVRRPGVMDDRQKIVEIFPDRLGGNLVEWRQGTGTEIQSGTVN